VDQIAPLANVVETALLVLVGLVAALATWRAADANRASADAARALNQSIDSAAKPRLAYWDRVDERNDRSVVSIVDAPAVVILRNYGTRAARVDSASFRIDDHVCEAELMTHSVAMPGDFVRFRLPWNSADGLPDARWAHDLTRGNGEGRLRLQFSYSEVDGTGTVQNEIALPAVAIRQPSADGATIEIVAPETPAQSTRARRS
jgi:hypothetical protein